MVLRKTLALILVAGLASMGAPLSAQSYAPNTLWGEVPARAPSAANGVLLDASGYSIATVPVVEGKFAFENAHPGQYVVVLRDAANAEVARSLAAQLASGGVVKVIFDREVVPVAAAGGGGGLGTTGWVLVGAGAVGLGTIIYFATRNDDGAQSPSR